MQHLGKGFISYVLDMKGQTLIIQRYDLSKAYGNLSIQ